MELLLFLVLLQGVSAMGRKKNLSEIFHEVKNYIGKAIYLVRFSRRQSQTELANLLKERFSWRNMDWGLINRIETGKCEISFGKLREICNVLECTQEQIIKIALSLKDSETRPEIEILNELKNEIEYRLWRNQQK